MEEYIEGGPLYIYVKDIGEDHSTQWIGQGLIAQNIVQTTRGALFTFDHRYFGNNIPVE